MTIHLLRVTEVIVTMTTTVRRNEQFWGKGSSRIFISHVTAYQNDAIVLRDTLAQFGMAAFVSSKDITPASDWQLEIEYALSSMDLFVAFLTEGFSKSPWTNQEVGIAYERKVPIFPVDRGTLPSGFISKIQALNCRGVDGQQVAVNLLEAFLRRLEKNQFAVDAFLKAISFADSFAFANSLAGLLPY